MTHRWLKLGCYALYGYCSCGWPAPRAVVSSRGKWLRHVKRVKKGAKK